LRRIAAGDRPRRTQAKSRGDARRRLNADSGVTLTDRIFDWARRSPGKTAVIYDGRPRSYAEFANAIAVARGFFARRGCHGPGLALVAVHNLLNFWIISLALRSLGLTTITGASMERILSLRPPGARFIVTTPTETFEGLEALAAAHDLQFLSVALEGETALPPDPARPAGAGGHVLLTSGTTGAHKMVLIDPAFELSYLRTRGEVIGAGSDSVFTLFNFAAWTGTGYKSAACMFTLGATVIIQQAGALHEALRHPATHASLVPEMLAHILAAPEGSFPRQDMSLSITSGTLTAAQVVEAQTRITPIIYNKLAATETNTFGYTPFNDPEGRKWHRPVAGRAVGVVDDADRPLAPGELGRLRVSTADGPTGYFGDETTTRAFFKDGYFYPGDLAVMREDGRFALQGRVTDVINMQGNKILPMPIEERLREDLGVGAVCLFSSQSQAGDEEIHVVLETTEPVALDRLNASIGRELHGYPVARVHYLKEMPRNQTGKVLRQAVKALAVGGPKPKPG
jgi:acyl-coenzyme A synthetase/AMP-(fatty) acid ligase